MAKNIDAALFLPGHWADGTEPIDLPLLAPDQICRLLNLYAPDKYRPFFPYIGEALSLMKSDYRCDETPGVNAWAEIFKEHDHDCMERLLCVLLLKYGWEMPDNVLERCRQYAKFLGTDDEIAVRNNIEQFSHFTHTRPLDVDDFELSRILYQLQQDRCTDHLVYISKYCINTIMSSARINIEQLAVEIVQPSSSNSKYSLYIDCVKTLVDICVLSSYVGIKIDIPDKVIGSELFRTCLLRQPADLLNYYCGDTPIAERFFTGVGRRLPDYDNKKILALIMKKALAHAYSTSICMLGIPPVHSMAELSIYSKTVLGVNPSTNDYSELLKRGSFNSLVWYCSGLANGLAKNDISNRSLILKTLAGIWRLRVGSGTNISTAYIAEVAKRIGANIDEVLSSSFSLRMSNVAWSLKDMPSLHESGLVVGPKVSNMIDIYVIKHAVKAQSITGLQQMVEVLNASNK